MFFLMHKLQRLVPLCPYCRITVPPCLKYSTTLETKYSEREKNTILQVLNDSNADFCRYELPKIRLKKFTQWRNSNGIIKSILDLNNIEGFSDKTVSKFYDSILSGGVDKEVEWGKKIRGQILQPNISEDVRKKCKTVLAVSTTIGSICWTLMDRTHYEVLEWQYFNIDHKNDKKLLITDILDVAWRVTLNLPEADIYVMKAEATTLRAAGSDPKNPKVLSINLQKAQLVSMLVALINARVAFHENRSVEEGNQSMEKLNQKVYFLRPNLPYRLYGTLIGNELISSDETVEAMLRDMNQTKSLDGAHIYITENLIQKYRSQNDWERDMLGQCLLLGMTFMDLCIYKNKTRLKMLLNDD